MMDHHCIMTVLVVESTKWTQIQWCWDTRNGKIAENPKIVPCIPDVGGKTMTVPI